MDLQVFFEDGRSIATGTPYPSYSLIAGEILSRSYRWRKLTEFWPHPIGFIDGKIFTVIERPTDKLVLFWTRGRPKANIWVISLALTTIVASFLFLIYRINIWLKPLKEFDAVTREIGRGNFKIRCHYDGKDEFGTLAQSLNTMAEQIKLAMEQQRQLLRDVLRAAHPVITRMKPSLAPPAG